MLQEATTNAADSITSSSNEDTSGAESTQIAMLLSLKGVLHLFYTTRRQHCLYTL